jgi:predicted ATPase
MGFFHFHDTSFQSPLRQNGRQADSKYVRSDGSNLAAYLYRLKQSTSDDARAAWALLEGLVRRVAPFIKTLEPDLVEPDQGDASAVRLYWHDEKAYRFDVHDLSDGTLRAIALFAALTQPPGTRPKFITIDEPELGLHPAALSIFAGLVRSASAHSQILVATQSPALLDEFAPDEVIVAERRGGESGLERLDPKELEAWLEDYSLSQLYDKNVLGGRP